MSLTDEQWKLIEPELHATPKGPGGQGRPSAHSQREILEVIFWKLKSDARWDLLPDCYPPYQTCHRWLQFWRKTGIFEKILFTLANMALGQGKLGLKEAYIDATFAAAKKGGLCRQTKKGKGTKIITIVEEHGYPIALHVENASPREATLVDATVEARIIGGY